MRIVKTGTPRNLYRLRPPDLPSDKDLTHSFFEYVHFGKLDLSDYDLRDMTMLDCDLSEVTGLPSGDKLRWIYSRRTKWPVGQIPDDIPLLYEHDMVSAWAAQRVDQLTGRARATAIYLSQWVTVDYSRSMANFFYGVRQEQGISNSETKQVVEELAATAPQILKEVQEFDVAQISDVPLALAIDPTNLHVPYGERIDISGDLTGETDRYLLARHLESVHLDIRFWVRSNDPMIILTLHRDCGVVDEDFWWRFGP